MLPWPNPPIENVTAVLKHIFSEVSLITGTQLRHIQLLPSTTLCDLWNAAGDLSGPWLPVTVDSCSNPNISKASQLAHQVQRHFYVSQTFRVCL